MAPMLAAPWGQKGIKKYKNTNLDFQSFAGAPKVTLARMDEFGQNFEVPVVNAGTHFAQNLEIQLHPGQPSSGRHSGRLQPLDSPFWQAPASRQPPDSL